jgi:hypothetical protein
LKGTEKVARSGSVFQRYGCPYPDPYQNVTDQKVIELGNLFCALFKVKIPKFFDEDLRSGLETVRIRGPG